MKITEEVNSYLLQRVKEHGVFSQIEVNQAGFFSIQEQLSNIWTSMERHPGIVSIIPFGPKPIVAGLAFWALRRMSESAVEICYSLPRLYDSSYSEGIRETYSVELVLGQNCGGC